MRKVLSLNCPSLKASDLRQKAHFIHCDVVLGQVTVLSRAHQDNVVISLVQAGRERHLDR